MKDNNATKYAIKFTLASLISLFFILGVGLLFTNYMKSKNSTTSAIVFDKNHTTFVVIDPGHGGEDAGAVANDGTLEKDLNLKVALLTKAIFELNGNTVIMTR